MCIDCGAPAVHTDHIIRPSGPCDPLFWDPVNHAPRCKACHSRKAAAHDGGFGNKVRP